MSLFNIPYELAVKLDLTDDLFDEDLKAIKEDGILEDVKIEFTPVNGYIVQANFKYTILNHNYGFIIDYNTSSPYALYMCELQEYNDCFNESESD
jgi:hypothetical protein